MSILITFFKFQVMSKSRKERREGMKYKWPSLTRTECDKHKMNAVIALCTFCEMHGPKVVFTTQTYRNFDNQNTEKLKFYGPKEIFRQGQTAATEAQRDCEGCRSLGHLKYLSNEHETRTSFLSAQQSLTQDIGALLKHACIRYSQNLYYREATKWIIYHCSSMLAEASAVKYILERKEFAISVTTIGATF